MTTRPPIIWVLKSFRAGDNAQAMALAHRVGGSIVEKQMVFNRLAAAPNFLGRISIRMLTNEARALLAAPWPDLVIATGRRTAVVSLWIKQQSQGRTRIVQLGRPRLPLKHFDLVITTPQYGLPSGANIVQLPLPFVATLKNVAENLQLFHDQWNKLPKPWLVAVVGGQKFPLRLRKNELEDFGSAINKLARDKNAGVILLASPRSPKDALSTVSANISQPKWLPSPQQPNAYRAALQSADLFCVSSDSVSMVAEMLATNKPVFVHELPQSPFMPHWSAESGIAAKLAHAGVFVPPRNVAAMMRGLMNQKIVGDLKNGSGPLQAVEMSPYYEAAVQRVRSLIGL